MHPVLELILERHQNASQPGKRTDDARLGLAVEGGGMRGVVSLGMLSALESLDLLDVFDVVFGSSAGSMNAAFFLAKQAAYATTIYYEDINNSKFVSFSRAPKGEPVMSLEYLIDEVFVHRKILDWKSTLSSPIPLKVVTSSVERRRSVVHSDFKNRHHLFEALRASARIPVLAGPPVLVDGEPHLDASLFEPIPYPSALEDGCTHVLNLLTRRENERIGPPGILEKLIPYFLSRSDKRLTEIYHSRSGKYNAELDFLESKNRSATEAPYLCSLSPAAKSQGVGRLEKNEARLKAGAISGMDAVIEALYGKDYSIVEVLAPFDSEGKSPEVQ